MLCISATYAVGRLSVCLSVRLSVCPSVWVAFVYSVETSIFELIYHSSFPPSNFIAIFRRGLPKRGVKCICVWQKSLFSTTTSLGRALSTLRPSSVINAVPPDRGNLVTLIAGSSKRLNLLMAEDGWRSVYDKKPERYAEDNRTAFEAEVTNNRRVRSRYCIRLKITTDRHEASRGLSACHGIAGTENTNNGRRTNAAAEASWS